jgi:hypothetical protein
MEGFPVIQIGAMLAVAGTWCLLGLMFFGVGRLVCRTLRLGRDGWRHAHLSFWIGWGTTIVILQGWHLLFPVDYRILLVVALLGSLGLLLDSKVVIAAAKAWLDRQERQKLIRVALVVALVVGFWSSLAIGLPLRGDTANYHMPAVRWISAYPIVPGLGNLHGRLAFNNSSFLYAAMLDVGPWSHRSHHLAHGLMAVVAILYFLSYVPAALGPRTRNFPVNLLNASFFPIAVLYTYKGSTSYQPDLITFVLGLIVSSLLFELLVLRDQKSETVRLRVFAICFLSSVGLTVKLSFLPLGFLASVMALGIAWKQTTASTATRWGLIAACCLSAVVAIVPWTARGVVLSGYLAYPSTVGAFDVPWKIPLEDVRSMQNDIVGYARLHGTEYLETLDNYDWVGPVILRELGNPMSVTIPLVCTLIALVGVFLFRRREVCRSDLRLGPWLFLVPAVAAVLFMLFTAPCPRFCGAAIWVIAVGTMILSLDRLDRSTIQFRRGYRFALGVAAMLLVIGVVKASRYTNGLSGETAFVPTPDEATIDYQTESGLIMVFTPDGAWDAALPNSPYCNPKLALIRAGDLGSGFEIRSKSGETTDIASDTRRVRR